MVIIPFLRSKWSFHNLKNLTPSLNKNYHPVCTISLLFIRLTEKLFGKEHDIPITLQRANAVLVLRKPLGVVNFSKVSTASELSCTLCDLK